MATRRALAGLFGKAKGSSRGFASGSVSKNYPGEDNKHWIVEMEPPKCSQLSVSELIENYVQTAATVLGRLISIMLMTYKQVNLT